MTLYSGRFEHDQHALFRALNSSLPFDWRLVRHDILGSIAWASAIHRAGVLDESEADGLIGALKTLLQEAEQLGESLAKQTDEDVHSWVERRLVESIGSLGKKLHTGRSRNDQVATDLRLWCRDEIDARLVELRAARVALLDLAEREKTAVMPGYTHLQRAQPILLAHWALAYEEMLARDAARFTDARRRVNICPLGSGALAGSAYPIDRAALARELGFDAPTANSLDAVSDRDFVLETLAAASLTSIHLSRLAEDLIIWSSSEFGFVQMSDEVTSGSSLMPQKKNP
ncbi:MAG TPA: argininosuccinate lyase, partial [Phycisphaerales bacterium]|nr:argininosuccinate lyase [Phycisphaerales bacterium]